MDISGITTAIKMATSFYANRDTQQFRGEVLKELGDIEAKLDALQESINILNDNVLYNRVVTTVGDAVKEISSNYKQYKDVGEMSDDLVTYAVSHVRNHIEIVHQAIVNDVDYDLPGTWLKLRLDVIPSPNKGWVNEDTLPVSKIEYAYQYFMQHFLFIQLKGLALLIAVAAHKKNDDFDNQVKEFKDTLIDTYFPLQGKMCQEVSNSLNDDCRWWGRNLRAADLSDSHRIAVGNPPKPLPENHVLTGFSFYEMPQPGLGQGPVLLLNRHHGPVNDQGYVETVASELSMPTTYWNAKNDDKTDAKDSYGKGYISVYPIEAPEGHVVVDIKFEACGSYVVEAGGDGTPGDQGHDTQYNGIELYMKHALLNDDGTLGEAEWIKAPVDVFKLNKYKGPPPSNVFKHILNYSLDISLMKNTPLTGVMICRIDHKLFAAGKYDFHKNSFGESKS